MTACAISYKTKILTFLRSLKSHEVFLWGNKVKLT